MDSVVSGSSKSFISRYSLPLSGGDFFIKKDPPEYTRWGLEKHDFRGSQEGGPWSMNGSDLLTRGGGRNYSSHCAPNR